MRIFIVVSCLVLSSCIAADIPCAARAGAPGQGQICVCNSTYCDTIAQPTQLGKNQFHYYKTSNSSPGFTHSILNFSQGPVLGLDPDEVIFKIDSSERYQEHVGIGGAFTDSMGLLFNRLSPGTQYNLMKSYFGPSGIEYSFARVPIGSTDFSQRVYTLDDVIFDEDLSHFSLAEEDHMYRIPLLKKAKSLSERKILLSVCTWAAPYWMKVSQVHYANYVADKYSRTWAKYHIKFLQAYQEQGLDIWSLSAGNEPVLQYILPLEMGTLNSTLYTADSQARWFRDHLRPELAASNFSQVKLLGLEDQTPFLTFWMDAFKIDSSALAAINGIGLHWYFDRYIDEDQYKSLFESFHQDYPDKIILYTEGSINGGFGPEPVLLGSWFRAEGYIYRIFQMLDNWNVGFIDWNLFLDTEGGPTTSFGIECPVIVNTTSDEIYKQPMFYAIGHFSKFIQPGSVKIKVTSNQNVTRSRGGDRKIRFASAVESLAKKRLGDQPVIPPMQLPQVVRCLAASNPDSSVSVIVINTKNITVPVRIEDTRVGSIVMDIEQNSINSFVYWP